jgi:predicted acylesterase/phospholipase RssA
VSTATALGAEFVIALNVLPLNESHKPERLLREQLQRVHSSDEPDPSPGSNERSIDDKLGLVEIVWHASRILASQIASVRLRDDAPGYLLQIPVPELGPFDFHRTAELAEIGRRCAKDALPELERALERALPLGRRLRRSWRRRAPAVLAPDPAA